MLGDRMRLAEVVVVSRCVEAPSLLPERLLDLTSPVTTDTGLTHTVVRLRAQTSFLFDIVTDVTLSVFLNIPLC